MMTKCVNCGHEFHNIMLRQDCPKCGKNLKTVEDKPTEEGFDSLGFAFGMATGVPISPTHGFSVGSMLGAALHSNPSQASTPTPEPDSTPSTPSEPSKSTDYDASSNSSSYDSGSSSSSFDSGSSGGNSGSSD